jgi:multisubunit Na+/H+ antiporter MnhB subunit
MQKMFIFFLAVFFPWIIFLINDNPGGAFVALALQATVIGWPFVTIWALRTHYPPPKENHPKKPG